MVLDLEHMQRIDSTPDDQYEEEEDKQLDPLNASRLTFESGQSNYIPKSESDWSGDTLEDKREK